MRDTAIKFVVRRIFKIAILGVGFLFIGFLAIVLLPCKTHWVTIINSTPRPAEIEIKQDDRLFWSGSIEGYERKELSFANFARWPQFTVHLRFTGTENTMSKAGQVDLPVPVSMTEQLFLITDDGIHNGVWFPSFLFWDWKDPDAFRIRAIVTYLRCMDRPLWRSLGLDQIDG